MTEAKHTPLPWTIEESQQVINLHNHTLFQIVSDYGADKEWSGTGVAACMVPDEDKTPKTIEMVRANAELIVRAVNFHDALVKICGAYLMVMELVCEDPEISEERKAGGVRVIEHLKQTLAKATGEHDLSKM